MKPHFLCSVSVPVLCQASRRFSPPSSSQDLVCSILLFYSPVNCCADCCAGVSAPRVIVPGMTKQSLVPQNAEHWQPEFAF